MGLKKIKHDWENLARTDPLWAICNDPLKKNRQWDKKEFFLSGETEINAVINYIQSLGLKIDFSGTALDFGCGVGRLTQALAKQFNLCYGVDISPTMIKLADQYNLYKPTCAYLYNYSDKLGIFNENTFSFIYSSLTLQHIKPIYIKKYLEWFIKILKPGNILVFQLPHRFVGRRESMFKKLKTLLRIRTRIKYFLKLLGLYNGVVAIYNPRIETHCMSIKDTCNIIESHNAKVVDIVTTNSTSIDFNGKLLYFKGEEPFSGYISKQYCVIKA